VERDGVEDLDLRAPLDDEAIDGVDGVEFRLAACEVREVPPSRRRWPAASVTALGQVFQRRRP
jgi:hypothetical protein